MGEKQIKPEAPEKDTQKNRSRRNSNVVYAALRAANYKEV
jgi:hypothetical protein